MTSLVIPVQPIASQYFDVTLNKQDCRIALYQKREKVYFDLVADDKPIITGAVARDRSYLIRAPYMGFVGDLYFVDTQGSDDPVYTGLGTRFILIYEDAI